MFQWWHLLSLDAPTVAALWSWSMARAMHLRLPWTSPLLLALGTWLVYVADRILDGLPGAAGQLRERHFFYARHRWPLLAAGVAAAGVLGWLVVAYMSPIARREDTALFIAALIYFFLIHFRGSKQASTNQVSPGQSGIGQSGIERWFPKEFAVAVVFAAAVAVPAWSRLPGDRARLVPLVALFALLCWLNCVAIEKWERSPISTATSPGIAPPHSTTQWAGRNLLLVSGGIVFLAAIAALQSAVSGLPGTMTALYFACAISAGVFPVLDRSRLDSSQLRIAADAALLTPLLFIAVLR